MQPQLENSGDRYGWRESALFAVLVVVLLRLLTHLLMVRMSRSDRTQGVDQDKAKHNAQGSERRQEASCKGLVQRIDRA
jgi:hypothetical protein